MKSKITFANGHAFLSWDNGVAEMHHAFFTGCYSPMFPGMTPSARQEKCKAAALKEAKNLQPSVEEAMKLIAPEGYVFAGIDQMTQKTEVPAGFRAPRRQWKEEKKTDARIGKANWLLFRLSTGLDATFVPVESDWTNFFAAPRGAAGRIAQATQTK